MAVDRGSLRYRIETRYNRANLQAFRQDLIRSRRSFRELKRDLERPIRINVDDTRTQVAAERLRRERIRTEDVVARAAARREQEQQQRDGRRLRAVEVERRTAVSAEQARANAAERAELARCRAVERTRRKEEAAERARVAASRREERAAQRAAQAEQNAQREQLRRLAGLAAAQRQRERIAIRIRRQQERDLAAQRRVEEAEQRRRVAEAQAALQTENRSRRAAGRLGQTDNAAQRLLFTFRRLVGVLAAFTIARELVNGFTNLIRLSIQFNSSVEQSRLGIAGIVTAVGQIRDEQGRLVTGAEAFALAQGEARRQQELLRTDALRTTATFEELIDVFQIATGPGLAEGLNLDEIRQLSVGISQAASAIGLEQRQLSEEIRALLTGNIRATTTRIAQVLNLSNEDIRAAQEQGQLFDLLNERLSGFALAAEGAARTVPGLLARIRDAVGLATGNAGAELFEELRISLQGIFDLLTQQTLVDGIPLLQPDPRVLQFFDAVFDSLAAIVRNARTLATSTGFGPFLATAQAFGQALQVIGSTLVAIGVGIVRGFGTLSTILGPLLALITSLTSGTSDAAEGFQDIVALVTEIATILITVRVATIVWLAAVRAVQGAFSAILVIGRVNAILRRAGGLTATWAASMRLIRLNATGAVTAILALPVILAAIVGLVFRWASEISGVKLEFETILRIIGTGGARAWEAFRSAGAAAVSFLKIGVGTIFSGFISAFQSTVDGLASALSLLGFDERAASLTQTSIRLDRVLANLGAEGQENLKELEASATAAGESLTKFFEEDLNNILSNSNADRSLAELLSAAVNEAKGALGNFFGDTEDRLAGLTTSANEFAEALAVTGRVAGATQEQRDAAVRARQQAESARQELAARQALLQVQQQGGAQAQVALISAQNRLEATRLESQQAIENLERERAAVELRGREFEARRGLLDQALELARTDEERNAILAENGNLVDQLALASGNLTAIEERLAAARQQQNVDLQAQTILVEQARIAASGRVAVARQAVLQADAEARAAIRLLDVSIQLQALRAQDPALGDDERLLANERLLELERQRTAEYVLQRQAIAEQKLELDKLVGFADDNPLAGLEAGFEQFALQFGSRFQATLNIATGVLNQFASFAAQEFAAIFDPEQNDGDSTRERLARFLQSLVQLIIQQIAQLLIATAIAKAFGVPLPGDSTPPPPVPGLQGGGAVGRAEGGTIEPTNHGYQRPKGLHPTDTVPIWAAPGEFMQRASAVSKYGLDVMEAINQGLVDPKALRALAGASRMGAHRRSATKGPGFQTGGLVSDQVSSFGATLEDIRDTNAQQDSTAPAVALPANDRTMEELLAGGRGAFRRFLRENAQDFDGILRSGS